MEIMQKLSLNGKATSTEIDCKYSQSALLNVNYGYKQNTVVILNPKNNKEKMNKHIC